MLLWMRKISKFLLFAIVLLSFLWLTNAQNWGYNVEYNQNVIWKWAALCQCDPPLEVAFYRFFLIILWLILLSLSLWTIFLGRKFKKVYKNTRLFYVPILNLYPLFKIILGKFWFYLIALVTWFLWYFVYINRDWCCHHLNSDTTRIVIFYTILITRILSILLLIWILYRLARNFGWKRINSILFALFFPIWVRILSFGNYEYIKSKENNKNLES
jgi:hypothetical protein